MGLDMYLTATKYVSGYDFSTDKGAAYNSVIAGVGLTRDDLGDPGTTSATVEVNVAYWRKANAIHHWFVTNCQDGEDDCRKADVSREQLEELLALCKRVKKQPDDASDVLPTKDGFFFGSTDYDEYFYQDIDNTINMIEKILNNPKFKDWNFQYQSSW